GDEERQRETPQAAPFRPLRHRVAECQTAAYFPCEQTERYQGDSTKEPAARPSEHRSASAECEPQSDRSNTQCATGRHHDKPDRSLQMSVPRNLAAKPHELTLRHERREDNERPHAACGREHADQ